MTTYKVPNEDTVLFRPLFKDVQMPSLAYPGSAAYDVYAYELSERNQPQRVTLPAHAASRPIRTGICLRPPKGYLALLCSRSGLAARGIFVANSPGVVDPDYTGELKVILYNGSYQSSAILHGERIAQLLFVSFVNPEWETVTTLPNTPRGLSGFGSSGS